MKNDIAKFADEVGRANIADTVEVGLTAVSNAITRGKFPAQWFDAIENMCLTSGKNCPRSHFSFKPPSNNAPSEGAAS